MPLEATMFCIDNSSWARNGDYSPSRLQAMTETVNTLANQNLNDNSESMTGFLSMGGENVSVHLSPCKNMGKFMTSMRALQTSGSADIVTALKIAQLTLKNRQNKNQRQRVIMFVCSPISSTSDDLLAVGKFLKKNNVAVDIVHFGYENSNNNNTEKLEALIQAVNNDDNSHLISVPPGPHRLADIVLNSLVSVTVKNRAAASANRPASAAAAAQVSAPVADAVSDDLDLLMESDPELAMALRMSLEENMPEPTPAPASTPAPAPVSTPQTTTPAPTTTETAPAEDLGMDDDEMDLDILAAIQLSLELEAQAALEAEEKAKKQLEAPKKEDKPLDKMDDDEVEGDDERDAQLKELLGDDVDLLDETTNNQDKKQE